MVITWLFGLLKLRFSPSHSPMCLTHTRSVWRRATDQRGCERRPAPSAAPSPESFAEPRRKKNKTTVCTEMFFFFPARATHQLVSVQLSNRSHYRSLMAAFCLCPRRAPASQPLSGNQTSVMAETDSFPSQ